MVRVTSLRATCGSIFSMPMKYCSYRTLRRSTLFSSSLMISPMSPEDCCCCCSFCERDATARV